MKIAAVATLYSLFMLFSGGFKHILLACILFAPGSIMFILAQREQGKTVFNPAEKGLFVATSIGAVIGIFALITGQIAI
jgi:arginine:ornithine antiporter/lysine permease